MAQTINLQKIVSVKGKAGLFHLESHNPKGYHMKPLEGGAPLFITNEKGKVLGLGNVDLKTESGSINLLDVFKLMSQKELPKDDTDLISYYNTLVEGLDPKQVAESHLKKVFKWYGQISNHYQIQEVVNEETDDGLTIV